MVIIKGMARHHDADDAKQRRLTTNSIPSGGARKKKRAPLKNINAKVHASNANYRTKCMVCGCEKAHLVNHYVKEHPNEEVIISRISPEMRTFALAGRSSSSKSGRFYETFCIFCEKSLRNHNKGWIQHLTTHTGEYQYECKGCRVKLAHTSNHRTAKSCSALRITRIRDIKEEGGAIYGYICNLCNYVQILEEAMIQHVKEQHEIEPELTNHYLRFRMLELSVGGEKGIDVVLEPDCTNGNPTGMVLDTSPPSNSANETSHPLDEGTGAITEILLDETIESRPLLPAPEKPTTLPLSHADVPQSLPQQQAPAYLKPWTKSIATKDAHIAKFMLRDDCLFNLYKCMATNCPFSDKSKEQMLKHLQFHQKLESSSVTSRLHMECAYCMNRSTTSEELVQHVENQHTSSVFMCQHCFYRSADVFGVLFHLRKYHRQLSEVILVGNCEQRIVVKQEIPALFAQWKQNIASITCNRGMFILITISTIKTIQSFLKPKQHILAREGLKRSMQCHPNSD